jgi:hypothetical protein
MPDEVAALPLPTSKFPPYVRAAARPDVRMPLIHTSIDVRQPDEAVEWLGTRLL